LGNGTNVTAADNVTITSPNGSTNIEGTNITANVAIDISGKEINMNNSNLSAGNIHTNATDGNSTITNNNFDTVNLTVDANGSNTFTGNNLNISGNVSLTGEPTDFSRNTGTIETNPIVNGDEVRTRTVKNDNPGLTINNASADVADDIVIDLNLDDWLEDEASDEIQRSGFADVEVHDTPLPTGEATSVSAQNVQLSTCYVTIDNVYVKYGVTESDMQNLTTLEIIEKYGINGADREAFTQACELVPGYQRTTLPRHSGKKAK
ncbi:hypothetical protein CKF54_05045, partial [Psittacicella hinzii]